MLPVRSIEFFSVRLFASDIFRLVIIRWPDPPKINSLRYRSMGHCGIQTLFLIERDHYCVATRFCSAIYAATSNLINFRNDSANRMAGKMANEKSIEINLLRSRCGDV